MCCDSICNPKPKASTASIAKKRGCTDVLFFLNFLC